MVAVCSENLEMKGGLEFNSTIFMVRKQMKKLMVSILVLSILWGIPTNAAELAEDVQVKAEMENEVADETQKENNNLSSGSQENGDIQDGADDSQTEEDIQDETDDSQTGEDIQDETDDSQTGEDIQDETDDSQTGEDIQDETDDSQTGEDIQDETDDSQTGEDIQDEIGDSQPDEIVDEEEAEGDNPEKIEDIEELMDEKELAEEDLAEEAVSEEDGLVLLPEEYKLDAEGNDLVLESIQEMDGSDEIMVQAVPGHGTIESDPLQENATVPNRKKINLKFKLRSYGNDTDSYTIMIYKSGSKVPLAKNVGTFSSAKGYSDYIFVWDTTNTGKYPPGTYEVLCFSSYESAKGTILNEQYRYKIHLEDYRLDASRQFVTRLYQKILGRQPDANGLKSWSEALYRGQKTGAQVTSQFVFSGEFVRKDLKDEAYVTVLYQAILGRNPDNGGMQVWKEALDAGMTRWGVLKGFISSKEFTDLCNQYGITRGTIETNEYRDLNAGATCFVGRNYSLALGRKSDAQGLNYWTGRIINKQDTPAKVARGFIFSSELANKNLNDTEFVRLLYKVLMNREADQSGLNYWVKMLKNKQKTRVDVFNWFTNSKEFKSILNSYHL